ncbi:hypothetical protein [Streptomyces sp. SR-10]|uniref:hypothetical protein n=1 Tax=Streptomyces sp. SR-10 TaxID=3416442 RepID=UPI003CEDB749
MICARCDMPLDEADAVRVDRSDSMSGARPDDWLHPVGDPVCRPYPATTSPLQAALRHAAR